MPGSIRGFGISKQGARYRASANNPGWAGEFLLGARMLCEAVRGARGPTAGAADHRVI
jgi:hypothetical protein